MLINRNITVLMETRLVVKNQDFIFDRSTITNIHLVATIGRYTRRELSESNKVNRFAVCDNVFTLMTYWGVSNVY